MTDRESRTRRTVLAGCAGVAGVSLGAGSATASTGRRPDAETESQLRTGIYSGTIDRIVDGSVVILVESGGKTVAQKVLSQDRVSDGEEGDSVGIWLFGGTVVAVWLQSK